MVAAADYRIRFVWQFILIVLLNLSLAASLVLIIDGFADHLGVLPQWIRLDADALPWADGWMALVSLALIVVLTYLPSHQRKPDKISLYITAPLAILICVASGAGMFTLQKVIPEVITGISLLGLTAGLCRAIPFSALPNQ